MRSATIYSCSDQSKCLEKETLIHEQLDAALATLATLKHRVLTNGDCDAARAARSMPGLRQIRMNDAIIALGRAAHHVLADVEKRTLIANDLDLEGEDLDDFAEDIEQLVWSCTNTLGIVALGESAWQSIQLLPIKSRRFYHVPPLRIAPVDPETAHRVLVINHDPDDHGAWVLADALDRAGLDVGRAGVLAPVDIAAREACWSDGAFIHVHVGEHTLCADELRLVDTWRSDRLALQLVGRRGKQAAVDPYVLMIEHEANGFICETPEAIAAASWELLEDRVLQRKVIAAGQNSVAPLVKTWLSVAADLLT